jgi:microcystin-dependent protein
MAYTGAGLRFVLPNQFSVDPTGVPRAGAQLFFYATGTTTYQDTYSDPALSVPNTNPVVADSGGQFGNVFLLGSPAYHVVLQDATGATIWDMDPVGPELAAAGAVPVGGEMDFAGSTAPAGWLLEYGQAISRTTYAALFAVIGTTYGSGDGSTTFNLPDGRGLVYAGVDNMGGTAANRITQAVSGVNGVVLGAMGGDQHAQGGTITLTDPGHVHVLDDPGHQHQGGCHTTTAFYGSGSATANAQIFAGSSGPEPLPLTSNVYTGITMNSAQTGITLGSSSLTGNSQNVQPTGVRNKIIYTGVGG